MNRLILLLLCTLLFAAPVHAQEFPLYGFGVDVDCSLTEDYALEDADGSLITSFKCLDAQPELEIVHLYRVTVIDQEQTYRSLPPNTEGVYEAEYINSLIEEYKQEGLSPREVGFKNQRAVEAEFELPISGVLSTTGRISFLYNQKAYTLEYLSNSKSFYGNYNEFKDRFWLIDR